ncbi:DUF4179 domain-containing protein [Oceanirhabdus sp. W0125-5]|uniref:DUF4179 domain-containing protein n=1 Tax=Oceanirhabdus sp. W0125-5 TaxID=2999116 RepID=UPI0022F31A50|nr:DUF4179 domain-containing protein [Oceanirhabdus sp. W0125-5]WBW99161.1 DUF4179 domain-containing protein [Oceanirhabdus sp. W0125-5]
MWGNKDEKINVDGIHTPDRADEFIQRGIKKGRRRGKIVLSQKIVTVALVIFIGGGFFSETLAQQLDFIPVLRDIYASFYKYRNIDKSQVEKSNDNKIIEKKVDDIIITINNVAYDDCEAIIFYEIKSKIGHFDIGSYRFCNKYGTNWETGRLNINQRQFSKNENGEYVVKGVFNPGFHDRLLKSDGDKMILAFDLWSKDELDTLWDNDITNNKKMEYKSNVKKYDVCFEFDMNEYKKEVAEIINIDKSLKVDDIEFILGNLEINPFSTVITFKSNNSELNGYYLWNMNLTNGTKNYRSFGFSSPRGKEKDGMFKFESIFFDDVKELYITSFTINQSITLEETLKIDFVNKTVNETYKEFVDIIKVSYDEEIGAWKMDLRWKNDAEMLIDPVMWQKYKCILDKEDDTIMKYLIYADKDVMDYEFRVTEIKEIGIFECNMKIK